MNCHQHTHEHTPGMGHGSAGEFLRRFWIVTFLLIPLAFTNESIVGFLGLSAFELNKWIQFVIATIIFGFSVIFFRHALHEIRSRAYGMMTLVSLAVGAGYLFSVASTFIPALEVEFYLEISTLIWVLLFGHYLEAKSGSAAGNALKEVAKLLPEKARRMRDGKEEEVTLDVLRKGDIVLVRSGERIPADGTVVKGSANVNESHVTGESKPISKERGADVVAGSIALDGSLTVELTNVGSESTIGHIEKLIREAQRTKPRSQRLADKAAKVLTVVAGLSALVTLVVWTFLIGQPFVFAVTLSITVLVIACPHALGLAIPTVTTITTSLAAKNGIFIKNLGKIEIIRDVDYVIFDKTGTLTEGSFGVSSIRTLGETTEQEILSISASLDANSSHVISKAIVSHAQEKGIEIKEVSNFENLAGKGVVGTIAETPVFSGNKKLMQEKGLWNKEAEKLERGGYTMSFVARDDAVVGAIYLSDTLKDDAREAVDALHEMGVKVAMLTGDNEQAAERVAQELNLDEYFADVLPEEKYTYVKKLQDEDTRVLMVGDGVNDAPALTQADAGVAIGAGTDVAVEAGDVVLTKSNPKDVVKLLMLAKKVYRKMIQNLVWALGYNVVAIPAAAGIFAPWGFFLRPEIGALVMSLSTVIVVVNALTLKRVDLSIS